VCEEPRDIQTDRLSINNAAKASVQYEYYEPNFLFTLQAGQVGRANIYVCSRVWVVIRTESCESLCLKPVSLEEVWTLHQYSLHSNVINFRPIRVWCSHCHAAEIWGMWCGPWAVKRKRDRVVSLPWFHQSGMS
jgi:hypothetical protein